MTVGQLNYPPTQGKELLSFVKTVTAGGTKVRLTTSHILTNRFTVYGAKDLSMSPNAGAVVVGNEADQPQQLVPYSLTEAGGEVVYQAPVGVNFDLSKFWINSVEDGDGVVVSYLG